MPDADVTNDELDSPATVTVNGHDLLRYEGADDLPGGIGSAVSGYESVRALAATGDIGELSNILAAAADLGLNGVGAWADPLNYLISAGLGFLIDVVQPLQDLIDVVSGDAEGVTAKAGDWERVGQALGPLAREIQDAAEQGLIGWTGKAADAAKARLDEFATAVASLANDVTLLKGILDVAAAVMAAIEGLIVSLIATFVEWLIITWTSAIAAAPPTLGASTAAAGAATAAEGAVTTSRAVLFMQRAVQLFQRLSTLLTTVRTGMIARAAAEFVPVAGEAPISLWQAEKNLLTAWDTVVGSATPIGAAQHGAVTDVVTGTAPRLTDDEQDRGLDPSR